eukprot:CAMPEP_0168377712 /NCGR_PEP_ID=MMETSP0228-20121227/10965_1 /TAXON_ID=133427 /ORGANISM="Protoceratium reticulatum, Strain CCCM 535 (=CCMP 1889)" /LENGTH=53 /DNA_ID=CAMNT_0008390713 /DNA_START=12 /DNA_END=169 /DNA_ORIENTATION=-
MAHNQATQVSLAAAGALGLYTFGPQLFTQVPRQNALPEVTTGPPELGSQGGRA